MVRIPLSWVPAVAKNLAGSGPAVSPQLRRIPAAPIHQYNVPVTVDLGNDGIAPNAVFTAAGTAQAVVGPNASQQQWSLDQGFLSTSVGLLDASQVTVYVGPLPLSQYAVTASLAGGGSQFGLGGQSVPFGWFVWGLWTGGTPGAIASLGVTGTKTALTN